MHDPPKVETTQSARVIDQNPKDWLQTDVSRIVPVLVESSDAGFTATTPVLPGCIAEGDTIEEALSDFTNAMSSLLETYKTEGMDVPWQKVEELPLNQSNVRIFLVPQS